MKIEITRENNDPTSNYWVVTIGDRYTSPLCWDEMLGFIARYTLTEKAQYSLQTKEQWDAYNDRIQRLRSEGGI